MAASDRNSRRRDEAERERHTAASEAAAFGTTAGTMLLGLLAGVDAGHSSELQTPKPALPSQPIEPAATEPRPQPSSGEQRHASTNETSVDSAAAIDAAAMLKNDVRASEAALDASHAEAAGAPHITKTLALSTPVWTFSAAADHTPSRGEGAGAARSPLPGDTEAPADPLAEAATGPVGASLGMVSQAIASLGATVEHLTSTVADTVNHLASHLTGLAAKLTGDAPVTGLVEPLTIELPGMTSAPSETSTTAPRGASLLDSTGAIPTELLNPLPLHLGFLGQATNDGHDPHDGAFSALGLHHF